MRAILSAPRWRQDLDRAYRVSTLHAGNRCARRARVSLRPTATIHERQEIADDAIELVGGLEVDGMAAVWHDGESSGGDILLHQHAWQQTRPILVSGQDERGNGQAFHLVDKIIK